MTDFVDWSLATDKMSSLFVKRVKKITQDIPEDEIVNKVRKSLLNPSEDTYMFSTDDPKDIDLGLLSEFARHLNASHRDRIRGLAESIGEIVGEEELPTDIATDLGGWFAGEGKSHVLMRVDELLIKVEKDMVIRILTLGELP
jgi:hypothetical protein